MTLNKEQIAEILSWFYELNGPSWLPPSELSTELEEEYEKLGGSLADFLKGGKYFKVG